MATFFEINDLVADFVFYNSLKASLLILLVWLAKRVFARQLSAQGHYLLWLAVVICLTTPIGFTTVVPQLPILPTALTQPSNIAIDDTEQTLPLLSATQDIRNGEISEQANATTSSARPTDEIASMLPGVALPLLWLSGVLLFIGIVLIRHKRFARVVRAAVPASSNLQALLNECRQQAACRRNVRLLYCADIDAPLITGCFQSVLLLPTDLSRHLSDAQLRHVFMHELMHVRNHDIAANWLLTLLQAFHWFNPLVWFAFRQLRFDRELARDAATLNCLAAGDGQQYGQTLLQLSQPLNCRPQTVGALGIVDDHTQLRRRIIMIVQGSLSTRFQSIITATLLLLFGTMAFSKPALDVDEKSTAAATVVAAPTMAALVAQAPATTATTSTVDSLSNTTSPAVTLAPGAVTNTRAITTTKVATAIHAAASATAASERGVSVAAATEPALTLALADVAAPSAARQGIEANVAKPETYPDWNAIQTLAKEVTQARGPGVKFITDLRTKAAACPLTIQTVVNRNDTSRGCGDLYRALTRRTEIASFWNQCVDFMTSYNHLAANFARAEPTRIVEHDAIKTTLEESHNLINEFCSPQTYHQQYPEVSSIIAYALLPHTSRQSPNYNYYPGLQSIPTASRMEGAIWVQHPQ